jgi:hypothetical protein
LHNWIHLIRSTAGKDVTLLSSWGDIEFADERAAVVNWITQMKI